MDFPPLAGLIPQEAGFGDQGNARLIGLSSINVDERSESFLIRM